MRDWLVVIDQSALGLNMKRGRCYRLGDGKHGEERVAVGSATGGFIRQAAPDVDSQFAIQVCGNLQADLAALGNSGIDGLLNYSVSFRSSFRCHGYPSLPGQLTTTYSDRRF